MDQQSVIYQYTIYIIIYIVIIIYIIIYFNIRCYFKNKLFRCFEMFVNFAKLNFFSLFYIKEIFETKFHNLIIQ